MSGCFPAPASGTFFEDNALAAGIGFTDIVKRATSREGDVTAQELAHGRAVLARELEQRGVELVLCVFRHPVSAGRGGSGPRVTQEPLVHRVGDIDQNAVVTTQHIGAAGELLVQYLLLKHDIDSARLTTDAGVDLVVYSPRTAVATTVQVKTVRAPAPAGGRGPLANGWWFPHTCPAEMLALVRLSTDSVWLFTLDEARELAQQHNDKGNRQIYWYTDERKVPRGARREADVARYTLDRRVGELFLGASS